MSGPPDDPLGDQQQLCTGTNYYAPSRAHARVRDTNERSEKPWRTHLQP
jgi:hypothetical protein